MLCHGSPHLPEGPRSHAVLGGDNQGPNTGQRGVLRLSRVEGRLVWRRGCRRVGVMAYRPMRGVSDRTRKILWARAGGRCSVCRCQVITKETEPDDPSVSFKSASTSRRSRIGQPNSTKPHESSVANAASTRASSRLAGTADESNVSVQRRLHARDHLQGPVNRPIWEVGFERSSQR